MSQQSGDRARLGSFFIHLKRYLISVLGVFLMALGINLVYEPLSMVTGGFSGIAILIRKLTVDFRGGIPVGLTTLLLNIPLFLWGWKQKGLSYVKDTMIIAGLFSLFLSIIPTIEVTDTDYFMAAVAGGALNGIGLALVFSQGMSTGGSDLLSSLLQSRIPYFSVARILLFIDGGIVAIGMGAFGIQIGLYSIIAVFVTTKVMDGILEGLKYAKMVYIISGKEEEIAKHVLDKMHRGVTGMDIEGMYSGTRKRMLLCVVSRKEVIALTKIVEELDSEAFVIVADVREVKGEGFIVRS